MMPRSARYLISAKWAAIPGLLTRPAARRSTPDW